MDEQLKKAFNIAKDIIGPKLTATDKEIDDAVSKVSILFPEVKAILLKNYLLADYTTSVDGIHILDKKDGRKPWLKDFKAEKKSDWDFWHRYHLYMEKDKGFSNKVINQVDDLTDKVLDRLFDPTLPNIQLSKRGLVVGQVQAGKTSNYIGLINKAADAGFNLIIVLAGIHNNLRSQTQTRLDAGFLGFDTQFVRKYEEGGTNKIGVGLYSGFKGAIANSITTSEEKGDFTKKAANSLGINFDTPHPLLLVIKKNISIMKRVLAWLTTQCANGKISSKALLLIDDEADNASVNTSIEGEAAKPINAHIRMIMNLFNRSAYVGYTATPFANIFIPLKNDPNLEEDLFPKDFIINIPAPSNYIGPDKVFGITADTGDPDGDLLPIVNKIDDYEDFVPTRHKKDGPKPTFNMIPESLKTAIKCFIMTCAIRLFRGQKYEHNSMLIHVTRYQNWQNEICQIVDQLFKYYKQEIEAEDKTVMEEMRKIFEEDSLHYKSYRTISQEILNSSLKDIDSQVQVHNWDDIKKYLFNAVQKIEVKSINGSSGDSLTYYEHKHTGISIIAIGGDKLSRGLTLEGLSVSYFLRASKMYDTLMQMGRWFGYRPGYVDLCRLFTSGELNEWYRHITTASAELIEEFNYLAEINGTPDNYSLKVRSHPGILQITSLAKMRYTDEVQVSWAGRLVETYQLPADKQSIMDNLAATDTFLNDIGRDKQKVNDKKTQYLWRDIQPSLICEFLEKFKVANSLRKVNFELINEYIKNLNASGELTSWNVVLFSRSVPQNGSSYQFSNGITVNNFTRYKADDTTENTYCIRKNHILGHREDEFVDLDYDMLKKAYEETVKIRKEKGEVWAHDYPAPEIVRRQFRPHAHPLLMIYPLNAEALNDKKSGVIRYKDTDEPFIGLAISFPESNRTDVAMSYVANRIEEFAETEDEFDNTNNDKEDDE